MGVSGGTGTNSRAGWRALNARLVSGDTLVVVAIDRIGRRWMDTVNAVRDLRTREVRIRSLAQTEATWVTYVAAEPDTAEAVIGCLNLRFRLIGRIGRHRQVEFPLNGISYSPLVGSVTW